jgi:glutamine synthetase type III
MSAESKKQFISDHKEQVRDANLLIGYLNTISGIEKKRAEIEKEIAKTVKDEYTARIKGIKEVEEYQQKLADQTKRSHLALLGYYATDTDKAIAEQVVTRQKLAASNAALEYAKKHGINIFTDQTMSEERVKNLELQAQVEQQNTFGTPEARYKQRLAEIEYQHKLSQAQIDGDQTSPMNTQAKLMSDITAAKDKVKALTDSLKEMQAKDPFANQTEQFKKYNLELKEAQKNAKELAETYTTKMRQGVYDVTNELLLQGKKISDIWEDITDQVYQDIMTNVSWLEEYNVINKI